MRADQLAAQAEIESHWNMLLEQGFFDKNPPTPMTSILTPARLSGDQMFELEKEVQRTFGSGAVIPEEGRGTRVVSYHARSAEELKKAAVPMAASISTRYQITIPNRRVQMISSRRKTASQDGAGARLPRREVSGEA